MKAGWKTVKLGEACKIVNGATPSTSVEANWGGPHCWITPAEMGGLSDPYVGETRRTLTDLGLADCSASLLPAGSVILSSRAPIGHVIINTVPMATNQGCKSMIPRSDLDAKFLFYFIKANVPLLESLGTGATFKELSGGKLASVEIPLPPLAEQKRIVALLDEAFAGIDEAKANTEANLENAKALFNSHVQAFFNQGTEGWRNTRLEEISTNLDSKRVPITKNIRASGEFPYYGASGIVDYVESYIFEGDNLLVSEDGANLLARSTPIAFSVTGKYWVNNHAHILHFENLATQRFVEFYLESIKLDGYITGAAQPKLTQKALNSIPIPIPDSIKEQGVIVRSLESLKQETTVLSRFYELKMVELKELKSSLLSKAFAGELTA